MDEGGILPHILLHGPAGTGKTTTARLVADMMDYKFVELPGMVLRTPKDLSKRVVALVGGIKIGGRITWQDITTMRRAGIDTSRPYDELLKEQAEGKGQIILVDEIHRLPRVVQEALYAVMDEGVICQEIAKDVSVPVKLPPTCVVGATTDAGLLTKSLRGRFSLDLSMEEYQTADMAMIGARIVERDWKDYSFTEEALRRLAKPARFNPRLLGNLISACIDMAWSKGSCHIDEGRVDEALTVRGLDEICRQVGALSPQRYSTNAHQKGVAFEHRCLTLLEAMGYEVIHVGTTGDGGIDIRAKDPTPLKGATIIVQCKDQKQAIGEPRVREFYGLVVSEGVNKGVFMTTADFTAPAQKFANGKRLELIDGSTLVELESQIDSR